MIAQTLKAYMPSSLFGRAVLIVVLPVGTILLVMSIVFIQRLYEDVTRQMNGVLGNELQLVVNRINDVDGTAEAMGAALVVAEPLDIGVSTGTVEGEDRVGAFDLSGRVVVDTLHDTVPAVLYVDLEDLDKRVRVTLETAQGPVTLDVPRSRVTARNPHQFLVWIGLTALVMTLVALIYLRNQVRPIRRLATAAEAFGRGRMMPYRPSGAAEVRAAGGAFLKMRDRIELQIEQRTLMLSGVSHDLRTPLTRMKLALGMMEETPETEDLRRDVQDMEAMLTTFLNFAQADALEDPERVSPLEIVERAVARAARAGHSVQLFEGSVDMTSMLRPAALGRALDNLIGNGARYGTNVRVGLEISETEIRFVVEDDGPGIREDEREKALEPFNRLDSARNQDSGSGVGLGLAIAADIARQHGGELKLDRSRDLGGLRAEIRLPR